MAPRGQGPLPRRADGAWRLLDDRHRRPQPDELDRRRSARRGHRGVEHRLSRRRSRGRWLSGHVPGHRRRRDLLAKDAATYQLDTRRIVAVGHSAGGHLALWLAGRANLPATSILHAAHPIRIDHVISLGGLPDLAATAKSPDNGCGTDVVAKLSVRPPRRTAMSMPTPRSPACFRFTSRRTW